MRRIDMSNGARVRPHHHRVRPRAVGLVADAAEQGPVGDTGGREEHLLAGDEVLGRQGAVQAVAAVEEGLSLPVISGIQLSLDRSADAGERAGSDHSFGRAAHTHQDVGALRGGREDGSGDVAIGDESHPGAGLPDPGHQVLVARTIKHHDRDIFRVDVLGPRHLPDVLLGPGVKLDGVGGLRAHGQLVHVHRGPRIEHRASLGNGDNRKGVPHSFGKEAGPVDGVDRHVHGGTLTVPDLLAVVEHRGLVLLPLADDHDAVHRYGVEHQPHGVHGRLIGALFLPSPHPSTGGKGRCLRDADHLHREVAVGFLRAHRSASRMLVGDAPSWTTRYTASWTGRTSPAFSARTRTSRADSTPSTVSPRSVMFSRVRVGSPTIPTASPNARFLPPMLVTRRSAIPARPKAVSRRPPEPSTKSAISWTARANRAARAFLYSSSCARPKPSRIPDPIAATFLAVPQSSTPTTSVVVSTMYVCVWNVETASSRASASVEANTAAAGRPSATSGASAGPPITTVGRS